MAITHREILLLESGAVRHDLRDRGDDEEGAEAPGHGREGERHGTSSKIMALCQSS